MVNSSDAPQSKSDPIEEKLASLSSIIEHLATKEDIRNLLVSVEANFAKQIAERDRTIFELEERIQTLCDQRIDDLGYSERVNLMLITLEKSLTDWKNNIETKIQEIENEAQSESSDIEDDDDDYEDNENNLKQPLDTLLISDSICKHINLDLINPGKSNKLVCCPGAKISEIREALIGQFTHYTTKNLVIHVMTNHVPKESPDKIASEMLEFIDEIKSNMPKSNLYIYLWYYQNTIITLTRVLIA